jgi:hypothetical protein
MGIGKPGKGILFFLSKLSVRKTPKFVAKSVKSILAIPCKIKPTAGNIE